MEVIDLLSDSEGDWSAAASSSNEDAAKTRRLNRTARKESKTKQNAGVSSRDDSKGGDSKGGNNNLNNGDRDDVILIDDDDVNGCHAKPSSVKNPYKKQPHGKNAKKCETETAEPSRDARSKPIENPYKKKRKAAVETGGKKPKPRRQPQKQKGQLKDPPGKRELQAGLVFEEDVDHIQQSLHSNQASASLKQSHLGKNSSKKDDDSPGEGSDNDSELITPSSAKEYAQHQLTTRLAHNLPPILYHDPDFAAGNPTAIDGTAKRGKSNDQNPISIAPPKCRCRPPKPCALAYSSKAGPNYDRPFYCCHKGKERGCNQFSWAFTSHMLHWYRFGPHNGHVLVKPNRGFRAEDLVQGKVGDCWFLSALAVVAEREDLIGRLIGANANTSNNFGVIEVKLFVDGYWKSIIIDDFLPCLIDQKSEKEESDNIQSALRQSLVEAGINPKWHGKTSDSSKAVKKRQTSSKFDPHSLADGCRHTLDEIHEFLDHDRFTKDPSYRANPRSSFVGRCSQSLHRNALTSDLAYSKARNNQLWVPFVEKAYAKIHGSYRAISGGHVEEAFLDLTGAPTAVYNFDHHDFNPRQFWSELMTFRRKRLPMGCGTSSSQGGIIGMHAYSILDVKEIKNVGIDFFREKLKQGTLGNVSGFTELDGTVRLLRIRNPHGQGEWKGEFSDKSPVWERLMANKQVNWKGSKGMVDLTAPQSPELKRTMVNDGTFWIDYDSFLMGFHNVDVVLAFKGNHAKSFGTSFPLKKSNHRCSRAFELSAVGRQPGEEGPYNEEAEVFVLIIQKTRRGASLGRADRKKSYKASDVGILVGEHSSHNEDGLGAVDGHFFGLNRNGHIRLKLNRSDPDKKLIVMPVSFGHPSATDEERSFVVRFVADAPLMVQELSEPPRLNIAMQKFCFGGKVVALGNAGTSQHRGMQGTKTVLMECKANKSFLFKIVRIDCLAGGGGTVLLYLVVNDEYLPQMTPQLMAGALSFSIEVNCRGMVCRTADGMVNHEVISKGKKFEAAWRRFSLSFSGEKKSRLLAAVVQGGQDFQIGSIKCSSSSLQQDENSKLNGPMSKYVTSQKQSTGSAQKEKCRSNYDDMGLFASFDTPSTILRGESIDLSKAFQNSIHNLDAAIMASIKENVGIKESIAVESQCSFSTNLERAIELSMKDL